MERKIGPNLTKDQTGLLKSWVGKCQENMLPVRRDVSPADLVFCLPSISIVERRPCGTYAFRLAASALRDILGTECRGKELDQICGRSVPWYEALNQAVGTKSPVFGQTPCGHRRVHNWMRLPLEPTDNGHQPLLCYDRIELLDARTPLRRETMFVTAHAFRKHKAALARSAA